MAKKAKATRAKMTTLRKGDVRTCFVIMPFGVKKDDHRKIDFEKVYRQIIEPGVRSLSDEMNIEVFRTKDKEQAGSIHERMIASIADADVAVVDLTTANANVYYELGVRHALRDRVTVLLRRKGKPNPFNIAGMSTIEYGLDDASAMIAQRELATFIRNGLASGTRDSLVFAVLPGLKSGRESPAIVGSDVEEYAVPGAPGKRIGIVSGNLRHTNLNAKLLKRPIDTWVSSENLNMQMARQYEASISGLIRYLGAKKDETGTIVEDTIADELTAKMKGRQLVNPGQIVPTGPGQLKTTHQVQRLFHAAAVYGVVGTGFHSIAEVEQCITNALAKVDFDSKQPSGDKQRPLRTHTESILFPILGTGTARADVIQNAKKQVETAVGYLRSRARFTRVKRIYFLAAREVHRQGLRVAFAELNLKRRVAAVGRTAKAARATKRKARQR